MKLKIPFTSIELSINFETSAGSPISQRKLVILDDISHKAVQQQFIEHLDKVILSFDRTEEGVASRRAAIKGVEEMLESNQLGQDDLNRALDRVVWRYGVSSLDSGSVKLKDISDLAIILHQAGGQFSKKSIKAIFITADQGSAKGKSDLLRYAVEKELISENTALSYSRSAKTSEVKRLMAFVYGGHVHGRFGSSVPSIDLIGN